MNLKLAAAAVGLILFSATTASAHILPWRAGDSQIKGFGTCAKGPCMKRADFSASKPHHHHGRSILGPNRHAVHCSQADRRKARVRKL